MLLPGSRLRQLSPTGYPATPQCRHWAFKEANTELAFLFIQRYRPFWTAAPPAVLPLIMSINQNPTEGLVEYQARINALVPGLYDKLTSLDVKDHDLGLTAARNVIGLLYDGNMHAPVQNDGTDMLKDYFSTALAKATAT